MVDKMQIARARAALGKAVNNWIFDRNVTLIGIGWPETEGQLDDSKVAIRFNVHNKFDLGFQLESAIRGNETNGQIPPEIDGIQTDVVQVRYHLHQFWTGWKGQPENPRAQMCTPIQCGVGISCERIYGSGTLGGLVRDRATGELMCLSNWHVLVGSWNARPPLRIFQPGRMDGGDATDTFAMLERDGMLNNLDAAVASLSGDRQLINNQYGLGPVIGVERANLGMEVVKSGYTSGVTYGRVSLINSTVKLSYSGEPRLIRNVFVIDQRNLGETVSSPGDSGALWLDNQTDCAVGLHFAGTDQPEQALAMDIQSVLDALQVDLVTG